MNVTLISGPDMQRGLILLQTGELPPEQDFKPGNVTLPENDKGYQVIDKGLKVGATMFGDRIYKIETLPPAFEGLTLLQTKGGHKGVADANYSVIVSAAKPCLVFVALDQRALATYAQHGVPGWLQEYEPTGERIKTDDPIMGEAGAVFQVFARKSAGGRIVLGPPAMDQATNSMYFVFFGAPANGQ